MKQLLLLFFFLVIRVHLTAQCTSATWLECSQTARNRTLSGTSSFSLSNYSNCPPSTAGNFQGNDDLYQFVLDNPTWVYINLNPNGGNTSTRLGLFLLDNCSPVHCISSATELQSQNSITEFLPAGHYYIIVENMISGGATYDLELNCNCSCSPLYNDIQYGQPLLCESFEQNALNSGIGASAVRWSKWDASVADAIVVQSGGSRKIRVSNSGSSEADVWMSLFSPSTTPASTGRYRISFTMNVSPGKAGNYFVLHSAPNASGNGSNTAYRVLFNTTQVGNLYLADQTNAVATFPFVAGQPIDVMQIIDISQNVAELWINHKYIYSWNFNVGSTTSSLLAGLNFDAHPSSVVAMPNFDFTIDDICLTQGNSVICNLIHPVANPICLKNGQSYTAPQGAACDLYDVPLESEPCPDPCADAQWLECSQGMLNQTFDGVSNYSLPDYANCLPQLTDIFQNQDRIYKFELKKTTEITIQINGIFFFEPGEYGLFLLDACSPANCIAAEPNSGPYPSITQVLDPGIYYVVVEDLGSGDPYTIRLQCDCVCTDALGLVLHCENFEAHYPGDLLSASSERWNVWNDPADDVEIVDNGASQAIRVANTGSYEPDIWLDLFPYSDGVATSGRYRLSFDLSVEAGKAASYYIHHLAPNASGSGQNIAYRVAFNANGIGQIILGDPDNDPSKLFTYRNGQTINVMQIIDLDEGKAEFWIDHNFIFSWDFNAGYPFFMNSLADLNFDAHPSALGGQAVDYTVDNLCFYTTGFAGDIFFPGDVCLKNGDYYGYPILATGALYNLDLETIPCEHICDYGGTLIYRGDTYAGSFDNSDDAPQLLKVSDCVQTAYNFNVPENLQSDVYLFHNVSGGPVQINFNNNGNSNTKCFVFSCYWQEPLTVGFQADAAPEGVFCHREPKCETAFDDVSTGTYTVLMTACDRFYYVVVTGLPGGTYSGLSVTPKGPCDINPPTITCGQTINTNITGTADPVFSSTGTAYKNCYPGTRTYAGAENFFKFTLNEARYVTITLNTSNLMGMFLYNFICGLQCVDYAETSASNPVAKISLLLYPGNYYIVVDKATAAVNNNFSISLDCVDHITISDLDNFIRINSVGEFCLPDGNLGHHVVINTDASADLSDNDKLMFLYPDNDGELISNSLLTQFWSQSQFTNEITIAGDELVLPDKCAFAEGDTFAILIYQGEPGHELYTEYNASYLPTDVPGINSTNIFENDGASRIFNLQKTVSRSFNVSSSAVKKIVNGTNYSDIYVQTGNATHWGLVEEFPADWLQLSYSTEGITITDDDEIIVTGPSAVRLVFANNTSEINRTTHLRLYDVDHPEVYKKFIRVVQLGICNPNPVLSVSATPLSVCGPGQEVTLTANVAPGMRQMFKYKWSNGDTSYTTKVYPLLSGTFTVTITNINCTDITKTASVGVTVQTLPGQPLSPQNRTICAGSMLTQPLAVSLPAGTNLIVNWYDAPTGGTLVKSNSLTYTPSNLVTYTYYAETRNTSTTCVSAQRTPVTLTVNPVPTLNLSAPQCGPDLTYTIVASTTGTDINATAGIKSVSNNVYTFSQLPSGVNVTFTAVFSGGNTCTTPITVNKICNCAPVSAPTPLQQSPVTVCAGTNIPALQVSAFPGMQVNWYAASSGGAVLSNGANTSVYQPSGAGTYYAEATEVLSGCKSARVPVQVIVNAVPQLVFVDTICHIDLVNGSTYSMRFTSTTPNLGNTDGALELVSNNQYVLSGISVGTSAFVYTENEPCYNDLLVQSPQCLCPPVAAPFNPVDIEGCSDETTPFPLEVSVPAGYQVYWFNQADGGNPLAGGSNTSAYAPPTPGTFYAEARDAMTGCQSSERTQVEFIVNPIPEITLDSVVCLGASGQYAVYFQCDADEVASSSETVVQLGNDKYVVSGVTAEMDLDVDAFFTSTGCNNFLHVFAPPSGCICPPIASPVSEGNKKACAGDNYPSLVANATGQGTEVLWYASLSTSEPPLAIGNQFLPPQAGTYYARVRDIGNGCMSSNATPVTLTIIQPPVVMAGVDQEVCAQSSIFLNGSVQGAASGNWSSTASNGSFFPNNNLGALTYHPPISAPSDFFLMLTSSGATAPCSERTDSIQIHVNALPVFSNLQFTCSPDRQTGYVSFATDATNVSTDAAYSVVQTGAQTFQIAITDIQDYDPFHILLNALCPNTIAIQATTFACDCVAPSVPGLPDTIDYCAGISNMPVLQPVVGNGLIVRWYTGASGGDPVHVGNIFLATGQGTYFMEAYDTISDCFSARKRVVISEHPAAIAGAGEDQVICPGTPHTLSAMLSVGNTVYQWSTSPDATPVFVVRPLQQTTYTLMVSTAFGCSATDEVTLFVWPAVSGNIIQDSTILCYGDTTGYIKWEPTGGTPPYQYAWNNGASEDHIGPVAGGAYTIIVSDSHQCADTLAYQIMQPAPLLLADSTVSYSPEGLATITVNITGGTQPYGYAWSREGVPIPAFHNSPSAQELLEGNYLVEVTDSNGCTFSQMFYIMYVPTNEVHNLQQRVRVFPNPTSGQVNIRFERPPVKETYLTLTDVLGREIIQKRLFVGNNTDYSLEFGDLPSALYLLTVKMEEQTATYRISLQK